MGVQKALQVWTAVGGGVAMGAAAADGRLGPFKAPLPLTKPRASAEEGMHY